MAALLRRGFMLVTLIALCQVPFVNAHQELAPEASAEKLLFLTWCNYIDPEVVQEFERKFNVKVEEICFATDDARDDTLVESDGHGYDVVLVNSPRFPLYWRRGWLASFSEAEIPNIRHIDARWMNALPQATGYGVPYSWGTTGIAYRADLVPEPITSWKQFFRPHEALRGKIVMVKTADDVIRMALKALGYSANSAAPSELEQAGRLLLAQKPFVKSYSYVSVGKDSELLNGRAYAAMMYNGDALILKNQNENVVYLVPEEGGDLWIDYLTVLQSSPRKRLAMDFISFVNEPANAARIARFVHYATPNKSAEELLPAKFLRNPAIYPSQAILEKSEFYLLQPPRVAKQRNSIFTQLLE